MFAFFILTYMCVSVGGSGPDDTESSGDDAIQTGVFITTELSESQHNLTVNSLQTPEPTTVIDSKSTTTSNDLDSIKVSFTTAIDSKSTTTSNDLDSIKVSFTTAIDSKSTTTSNDLDSIKVSFTTVNDSKSTTTSNDLDSIKVSFTTVIDSKSTTTSNDLDSIKVSFTTAIDSDVSKFFPITAIDSISEKKSTNCIDLECTTSINLTSYDKSSKTSTETMTPTVNDKSSEFLNSTHQTTTAAGESKSTQVDDISASVTSVATSSAMARHSSGRSLYGETSYTTQSK
ncbi:hypothetical protein BgiMline_024800 [Biomphalaria glabrata]|nr:hypothetical protein BgiMline_007981 [Biomphalaria glabrata]